MTGVDDRVAALVAAAASRREAAARRRAVQQAARQRGLAQRHANKLRSLNRCSQGNGCPADGSRCSDGNNCPTTPEGPAA